MRNLDDLSIYSATDASGMQERLKGLASQGRWAWESGLALQIPGDYSRAKQVVIAGMGGSAVGGDLIRGLTATEGTTPPITLWRDYGLPGWAGAGTLLIASSYSGNTEETLSAFKQGVERGCKVLAITSGGKLGDLAQKNGVPWLRVTYRGEPRTALGYTCLAPLAALSVMGFTRDYGHEVEEALVQLENLATEWSPENPERSNLAKSLAYRLCNRLVVVYGAGAMAAAARRWKTQLNENAKTWAFAEEVPEVSHNGIVGYSLPPALRETAVVVFLKCSGLSGRHGKMYEAIANAAERAHVEHVVLDAPRAGLVAQVLTTVYLGDWASYYLALLYGVDPSPVPAIDLLKRDLDYRQQVAR